MPFSKRRRVEKSHEQKIQALEEDNTRLRLSVYHYQLPCLHEVMRSFNFNQKDDETPLCECLPCCAGGRSFEEGCESCEEGQCTHSCKFQLKWEEFLSRVGATWNGPYEDPPIEISFLGRGGHADTDHHVYNVGHRDWVFSGWGKPLASLEDPRKEVWDRIVAAYRKWNS